MVMHLLQGMGVEKYLRLLSCIISYFQVEYFVSVLQYRKLPGMLTAVFLLLLSSDRLAAWIRKLSAFVF